MRDKKLERFRRVAHAFVRIHFRTFRMGHRNQLKTVDKHRLLKLVGNSQFIATVFFIQLIAADAHILIGIGLVIAAGFFEITHLTSAHKISDEFKALAIPCI